MSMDVGARIKAWREAKGWTQQELAEKVGVSRAAVFLWEGCGEKSIQTKPTVSSLEKVVQALGISMERFYGRVPKSRGA